MFVEVTQVRRNTDVDNKCLKRTINTRHIVLIQPISHSEECEILLEARTTVGEVSILRTITVQETYEQVQEMLRECSGVDQW